MKNKAHGGTMILWKKSIEKFITIIPCKTSSFLAILFKPPSCTAFLHICLYLPTSGLESEFVDEISEHFLKNVLRKILNVYCIFKGDSNVNSNHTIRVQILKALILVTILTTISVATESLIRDCSEQVERVFFKFDHP